MKVLMLGWEFPPYNSGGLGVACEGLAHALSEIGEDVIFVLPRRADLADERIRFRFADAGVGRMRVVDTALTPYTTSSEYARLRRKLPGDIYGADLFGEIMRYASAIREIVEAEEFDVIHAHDWLSFVAGAEAKDASGKPFVVHVHITSFEQAGGDHVDGRVYAIEKYGFDAADVVMTVSGRTRGIVIEKYGIDPNKVIAVHNGIDLARYRGVAHEEKADSTHAFKRSGEKLVVYIGRLTLHKGPDYFLRAARRVLDAYPDVRFAIAGSGDMEYSLVGEAAHLGIADRVYFTGFVRGDEWRDLLVAADLYVMPSVAEPFGLVPLEALVHGTPALISKQTGVAEVLPNALRVDFWDVDEMANKIAAALKYPPLARQLAHYGLGDVLRLTWRKAAEACRAVYERLITTFSNPIP